MPQMFVSTAFEEITQMLPPISWIVCARRTCSSIHILKMMTHQHMIMIYLFILALFYMKVFSKQINTSEGYAGRKFVSHRVVSVCFMYPLMSLPKDLTWYSDALRHLSIMASSSRHLVLNVPWSWGGEHFVYTFCSFCMASSGKSDLNLDFCLPHERALIYHPVSSSRRHGGNISEQFFLLSCDHSGRHEGINYLILILGICAWAGCVVVCGSH